MRDTKYSHRDNIFSLSPLFISLLFLVIVVPFQQALSAPQISIVWGTTTNASSSDVLKGFDGLPLSAGIQGNGDGDLVELGYFSEASTGNPFSGTWIPLTQQTRVGDSSSGYGFEDGMFIFTTNFFKDSDQVIVFPTEPKEYAEDIGFTITTSTPQTGTPICIRFYEEAYKGATKFNTVTGENWLWPPFPDGSSIPTNLYLKIASGAEPSGSTWRYGGTFEDNAPLNRFKTTIAPQYSIGIAISEYSDGTGSVIDINGSYEWGETIELTATPNEHSGFMGWVGPGIDQPSNQNTTLTVNGDQTVYAEFFAIPYELNLETSGEGTVSGSGVFTFGENVTISAFPSEGHSFVRWEKDSVEISTSPETSVTIEGKTDLVAIFSRNQYQVNIGASEGGSYEILAADGSNPSTYSHGFEYTLRALPDIHYGFNSWSSSSAGLSMIGNKVFAQTTLIPTSDVNFTAFFSELSYQLNIESTQGYKTLSASGNFPALSIVPIEVQPAEGFVFDYWLDPKGILADPDAHQTEANISLIYPYQEASISAILRLDDYSETDINVSAEFGGNIFLESDENGGFTHFKTYELNATAELGYHFDQWIGDTEQLVLGPFLSTNKILVEGPLSLQAIFTATEYKINLHTNGSGDTVGPETFSITESPTISAIAFPGWKFTQWTGDTDFLLDRLASETPIQLDDNFLPSDLNFTANFIPKTYNIQFRSSGNGAADIYLSNGDAHDETYFEDLTIDSETQITIEAIPADGWNFSRWSGLPDISELLNPLAFIDPDSSLTYFYPSKDLNITASFQPTEYTNQQIVINAGIGGDVFLETEENGNFLHFSSYDLNATPQKGYEFSQWIIASSKESYLSSSVEIANNVLTIEGPVEINATFSPNVFNLSLDNSTGGTTTGPSTFTVLDTPVIQAIPSDGWNFSHWSGDVEYLSDPNDQIATINHSSLELKSLSFTANFVRKVYQITLDSEGSGSFEIFKDNVPYVSEVTSQIVPIDSATRIDINAVPASGWEFTQWISLPNPNDLNDPTASLNPTSASINFIPSSDANLTAKFNRQQFELVTIAPNFGGSTSNGGVFPFESTVQLIAYANEHHNFQEWSGDIEHIVYSPTIANNLVKIPNTNISLQPIFRPKLYSIVTSQNDHGYFEITGTYDDITQSNQSEYNATSSLTISALPNNADTHMLEYIYWENSLGESGYQYSSTLNIPFFDGNYSFWSSFVPRNEIGYSLNSNPPYGGSAGSDAEHSSAQIQRLVTTPSAGYSFIGWSSETGNSFSPHWTLHTVDSALNQNDKVWANFVLNSQFVNLQYDEVQGSVSGFSDEIPYGEFINLTANPNENYAFSGWELSKEVSFNVTKNSSSIDSTYSRIFINEEESPELSLIRGFTYHFKCSLSAGDNFFISKSPDGDETEKYYNSGVTGHLTSNGILSFEVPADAPSTLYYHSTANRYSGNLIHISNVSDSSLLSNKNSSTLNERIIHHIGLKANFERTRHTLSTSPVGQGNITHTTQDIYFWGDTINISATPNEHWYFSHWEGNANLTDMNSPSSEFTITGDTEIRAIFKKVQYQVEVNASPSDYGITDELSETFSYGESVTLTATPLTGKQFDQWAEIENLSLNNSEDRYKETATFQILGNAKVQANFSRIPINVGVEFVSLDQNDQPFPEDIGGTINMPSSIYHGDFVTLDLNLFAGYNLLNWVDLDTGLNISSQDSISFTAVSDRNFKVVLRKLHYQLEVDQTGQGEASINMSPPYYWKDEIEISAVPDDHWEFFRWTGTGSENLDDIYSPSAVLSIEKNSDLLAEFREKEYYLNVFETPDGYGSLTDTESSYNFGDSVTIQATPRKGKLFDKWLIDGNVSFSQNTDSLSNPATFNVHGSSNIRANFVSKIYSVVYQVLVIDENGVTQENINGARIRGGTTFEDEEIAEFNISLNDGYKLLHWQIEKENPEIKSTDSVYRHQMLGDLNLTAVVTDRKYNVGVELSPASGGVVTLNDIDNNLSQSGFSYGENIRITATPSSGYRFVKWSATGTIFSSPDLRNQDFSISNDVKLTAHFAPTGEINLTLLSSPSGAASEMLGGGSFYYDPEHAILTAPKPGYLFSHWEYNGSIAEGVVRDANSSNTSLTLDGDKVLTAVFKDDDNFDPQEDSSIYLLSVYSNNANEGTTVGSGFFRGTRTIKAFPKSGFIFSHWEGDTPFDPHSPITEISVLANTSVVAHFKSTAVIAEPDEPDEELFQLIVSSNNLNHGTTKGSGFFPKSVRTIEAIPNTGYEFSHWEGSTFANEYSPITDIDVFAYTKVVAHFQSIGLFDDSEALENGWWVNPWFGYFWKVGEDDWLFHEKLGWIFLKKQGDSSIWIWIQKMNGWFWTAKDHYPYLHSESSHSWYWLNLEKSDFNGLVIYDYANAKWFSL